MTAPSAATPRSGSAGAPGSLPRARKAAAAAFRALGREPGAPADPLLGVAADGAVMLTPAGKEVVAAFEAGAGLEPTGVWSPAALRALPSG